MHLLGLPEDEKLRLRDLRDRANAASSYSEVDARTLQAMRNALEQNRLVKKTMPRMRRKSIAADMRHTTERLQQEVSNKSMLF